MMKKALAMGLGLVMVLSLAACGSNKDETTAPAATNDAETTADTTAADKTTEADGTKDAAADATYKAGTYEGTGTGMGEITVTLTIDDKGKITDAVVVGDEETPDIGGVPIEDGTYKDGIIAAQSADIDAISGATMTTNGVIKAVKDALSQAAE